jgi:hypothetical protein
MTITASFRLEQIRISRFSRLHPETNEDGSNEERMDRSSIDTGFGEFAGACAEHQHWFDNAARRRRRLSRHGGAGRRIKPPGSAKSRRRHQ